MDTNEPSRTKAPRWVWWIATGFGSGHLKPAPGTWGSLSALLAWLFFTILLPTPFATWAMRHPGRPRLFLGYGALEVATPFSGLRLGAGSQSQMAMGYWCLELVFLALPILMAWVAVKASDRVVRETGVKDPGFIVADEWAGMWIALWPLRWQLAMNLQRLFGPEFWRCLPLLVVPFLLFRLFDIWKPWPIRQIQVLPEGLGVVADDVVAGLYALVVVQLALPVLLNILR